MSGSPFMQSIHDFMRVRQYSRRTIDSYAHWIRCFIRFHNMRHPIEMTVAEVEQFLTHLVVKNNVAAATQAIALNALVFLYGKFLERPLGDIGAFKRSSRQAKLPVVLTREEVGHLLNEARRTRRAQSAESVVGRGSENEEKNGDEYAAINWMCVCWRAPIASLI